MLHIHLLIVVLVASSVVSGTPIVHTYMADNSFHLAIQFIPKRDLRFP